MTTLLKPKRENQLIVATILLVLSLAINIGTVVWVVNRPIEMVLIHKADNAVELHGKVTGKSKIKNLYTLDCGAYGKFLVSKEQYDSVNVGDDIPSYLKGRGN
ncbi:DUF1372 family protein [Streptococcus vestibularis]|uniref:DUF1372 family protein n=1 Tax=Streptococcus vestibularis TaxID=1343 RepID=UPI002000C622|nr:DUF1372 family protein [Streptococcus vestibularis]MDU1714182.1 DUF1372 family protein [Streptococcus vestibularis]